MATAPTALERKLICVIKTLFFLKKNRPFFSYKSAIKVFFGWHTNGGILFQDSTLCSPDVFHQLMYLSDTFSIFIVLPSFTIHAGHSTPPFGL